MTTLVRLPISQAAFGEIANALRAADYGHVFMHGGGINMNGIAIEVDPARALPPSVVEIDAGQLTREAFREIYQIDAVVAMTFRLEPAIRLIDVEPKSDRSEFYRDIGACTRLDTPEATHRAARALTRRQARIELQALQRCAPWQVGRLARVWLEVREEAIWRDNTHLGLLYTEATHFCITTKTKDTTTMKLENFERAKALVSDREYLKALCRNMAANARWCKMKVGDHDIRPDIVEKLLPDMKLVIEQQIAVVDQKLAEIGVAVA